VIAAITPSRVEPVPLRGFGEATARFHGRRVGVGNGDLAAFLFWSAQECFQGVSNDAFA